MNGYRRFNQVLAAAVFTLAVAADCARSAAEVRAPAVAGQFYPSDPGRLRLAIQSFMKDAVPAGSERPLAIVVPHAGYIYSGQISADAYRQVAGNEYDLVVILGTNHTSASFKRISVFSKGAYQTPLGSTAVDEEVARALLAQDPDCTADVESHAREHSVEVQVPFVQVLFPSAKILPVVIGQPDLAMCVRFGRALGKALRKRKALIVASSDLSHFPAYGDAVTADRETLKALVKLDPAQFASRTESLVSAGIGNLVTCACGEAPILSALAAAKELGATRGTVVSYANSGDISVGDLSRVVGYGAAVLTAGSRASDSRALDPPKAGSADAPLPDTERKTLLALARETIRRYLATETVPLVRNVSPRLLSPQGAFVTLKTRGELRGCMGHIPPEYPLARAVGAVSMQAAFNDPRFPPLTEGELRALNIEISVLTPMKQVARAEDIVIGRDGVVIRKNGRSAVFLPQVAVEQKWGRAELLNNLCLKAGLPADGWKQATQFFVFQAVVFDESQLNRPATNKAGSPPNARTPRP